jgi:general secretion pathway protein J
MRGIKTTFDAKVKSQKSFEQLAELQIAYTIIQKDLEQIVSRNVLEPTGGVKLSFITPHEYHYRSDLKSSFGSNLLEFTRTGNNTIMLLQPVSDLLRVAYFQDQDRLIRHTWRQIDPTQDTLVDKRRLLTNLEKIDFYFVDANGKKSKIWQVRPVKNSVNPNQPTIELPRGIIVNFTIKKYGELEWVFALPGSLNKA